ncbi:FUSC family protein [Nocardia higoensis]|uniref:FUSC family protein n=1 Tax=Nocardia higoensis TaxID=228599 RepID=UPI00059383E6|nr:FUSC family protein [Nocardia higoensis]
MQPSITAHDYSRLRHSRVALAHSVSPAAWRSALEVRSAYAVTASAIRVGAAVLIVLIGGGLLDLPQLSGFAALGALSSAFARNEPYRQLAVKVALIGVGVVAYVGLGAGLGVAGLPGGVVITALAVAAGVAFWLLGAFRIPGPGPVILIFAASGAAGFATTAADLWFAVAAAAIGAVAGWAMTMSPALLHPHGPSRIAVARALAAVSALETASAGVRESARSAARAAIARARETIALAEPDPGKHSRELLALLDAAETVVDTGTYDHVLARGEDFELLETELRKVRRDIEIPCVGAAIGDISAELARPENFLRTGVRALREPGLLAGVARVVVASLAAGWIAFVLGVQHPLWATMGAMAVLQGANYHHTVQRAIQRLLGNAAGALLAAAMFAAALGYWPLVVVITVGQVLAEMYVVRNYAIASIAVTTVALLLTGLGQPVGAAVAAGRVVDTLIGAVVGVLVAALTIARGDRHFASAAG